jgi:SAM-dependent methyltransferase
MSKNTQVWYRKLFPTAHKLILQKMINEVAPKVSGKVLVVGAGFGEYKSLFKNAELVICTDIDELIHIDQVADAHSLPFLDGSFDSVIAFEVFEHLEDPYKASSEVYRVLRNNGSAYISIPYMFRIHADPNDFTRFTYNGLIKLFSQFKLIEINALGNSLHVVSDIISTRSKVAASLRIFNHLFAMIGSKPNKAYDCPTGYFVFLNK